MTTTYKEGGKARKQCPKCELYVHARTLSCDCGHSFGERKTEVNKEPKTFNSPGRGRKLCNKCKIYCSARNQVCPSCKEDNFKVVVKELSNHKTAGRGRKLCPSCKKYVGVRTFICECKYSFVNPKETPVEETKEVSKELVQLKKIAEAFGCVGKRVVTAIGKPPKIHYNGNVGDYCEKLIYAGIHRECFYTPQSIKHLFCNKTGINKEYKDFCVKCDDYFSSIVS